MKKFFLLFYIAVVFVACQKETKTDNTTQTPEKTLLDLSYGSSAEQKMDVYLPANRTATDTKILILIHGGSWISGDKADFNEYIPVFKQRLPGYTLVNINYRLGKLPATDVFPTQETDVKAAVDFILSKSSEYIFNKEKVAVLGASAGGHLALLQSYKYTSPKVKALIDMFGPADMVDLYNSLTDPIERFGLQTLMSGTPTSNAALYQSASPINFITAQNPPTLILHGGMDPIVPISQSIALKAKLQAAGVPVQMVTYPTEGHGWTGANLTDSYQKIETFLTQYNP